MAGRLAFLMRLSMQRCALVWTAPRVSRAVRFGACAGLVLACGLACGLGCGGARNGDLFAAGDGTGAPQDAAAPVDGTAVTTTGERDAAAVSIPDTSTPPPPEDANRPDVAVPGDPGIRCGSSECTPGSTVCCRSGGTGNESYACLPAAACAQASALAIPCDDAADCAAAGHAGEVCCVSQNAQTGRAITIACAAASACAGNVQTNMCDPGAVDPCPNGGTCKQSQTTIPPYDICF